MSSRNDCYRRTPEVRVREVPEMEFCLAYVPARAELYRLNPSAWFVLRLCEGLSEPEMAQAYHEALDPVLGIEACRREIRAGLESLLGMGIIEKVHAVPRTARVTKRKPRRKSHEQEK